MKERPTGRYVFWHTNGTLNDDILLLTAFEKRRYRIKTDVGMVKDWCGNSYDAKTPTQEPRVRTPTPIAGALRPWRS